jgi:hypothetical protein
MKRIGRWMAAALVLPVGIGWVSAADKPADKAPPEQANRAEQAAKDGADAVQAIRLAEELAAWGRAHEHPVALATAARILETIKQQPMKGLIPKGEEVAQETEAEAKAPHLVTAEELLGQAREMTADDAPGRGAVEAAATMGRVARGAVGGAIYHTDAVRAHTTDQFMIRFKENEVAAVMVSGDGDTDLDLFVYDEFGNLIASDTDGTDTCYVQWTPRWTGPFLVRVKNLGGVFNRYTLRTN